MGKKKNNQNVIVKFLIAIIPTTIAAIAAIWAAYISLSQKTMTSENNSGTIIYGDGNQVSIPGDPAPNKKGSSATKEKVTLTGEMRPYFMGGDLGNERINIYASDGYDPIYDLQITNENEMTIAIENVFVDVLDYKDFSEFVIKNAAGGADLHNIICWKCNISPKKTKYCSILSGTAENNTENLSETKYVSIKNSDLGKFILKILPDTPGLYEIKIIIEYTSYAGEIQKIQSENMKFVYDPKFECHYQ